MERLRLGRSAALAQQVGEALPGGGEIRIVDRQHPLGSGDRLAIGRLGSGKVAGIVELSGALGPPAHDDLGGRAERSRAGGDRFAHQRGGAGIVATRVDDTRQAEPASRDVRVARPEHGAADGERGAVVFLGLFQPAHGAQIGGEIAMGAGRVDMLRSERGLASRQRLAEQRLCLGVTLLFVERIAEQPVEIGRLGRKRAERRFGVAERAPCQRFGLRRTAGIERGLDGDARRRRILARPGPRRNGQRRGDQRRAQDRCRSSQVRCHPPTPAAFTQRKQIAIRWQDQGGASGRRFPREHRPGGGARRCAAPALPTPLRVRQSEKATPDAGTMKVMASDPPAARRCLQYPSSV